MNINSLTFFLLKEENASGNFYKALKLTEKDRKKIIIALKPYGFPEEKGKQLVPDIGIFSDKAVVLSRTI